jgi:ATP-dependent DNA ligase
VESRAGSENQTRSLCELAGEKEPTSQHQHAITEEVIAQAVWLKPEQPAEIEFVERTPHGRLRHASFRRLLPRSGEK